MAIAVPNFRDNGSVSATVKAFLNEKLDKDQINSGFQYFKSAKKLFDIWELARNKENLFALQMLTTIEDKSLYSEGAMYVDEIPWENEKETALAVNKLCESGAVKNIESSIQDAPQDYNQIIYLLQNYGDFSAKGFVETLLDSLNREEWCSALKDNNYLLKCVPEKSANFGKAWADYFKLIVSGKHEAPELSVFKFQFELKVKVLDLKGIYLPAITAKYFENTNEDHLNDEEFNEISSSVLPMMKGVPQKDYEIRLTIWIEKNYTSRIKWFLNTELLLGRTPLESIVASVSTKLKTSESEEELALYKQLNEKLKLGLDCDNLLENVNLDVETK